MRHPDDCPGCGTHSSLDETLCHIEPPTRNKPTSRPTDPGRSPDGPAEQWKDPA